ncbi:MAG: DUF4097 family beta strand repeat-containing protein [Haloferacaceae archaeon]
MVRKTTRRRLLSGGAAAALASLAGCTGMTPFVGKREEGSRTVSIDDADALAVDVDVGELTLRPADRGDVRIDYVRQASSVTADIGDLELRTERRDGRLVLASEWTGEDTLFGGQPSLDLDVEIPRSLPVERIAGSVGSIDVRDVAGDLAVETSTGSVTAAGVDGTVTVSTSTGSVDVRDPGALGDVSASTGSIDVEVPAIDGDTSVTAETGSIDVALASDLDLELRVRTGTGSVDVDLDGLPDADGVGSDPTVAATLGDGGPTLTVETDTGSVTVSRL